MGNYRLFPEVTYQADSMYEFMLIKLCEWLFTVSIVAVIIVVGFYCMRYFGGVK